MEYSLAHNYMQMHHSCIRLNAMKKQFETFVQFMKARNGYARRDCNLKCV